MNAKTQVAIALFGAAGGIAAFLTYLENRKERKERAEVLHLDKQIKALQLSKMKTGYATI